MQFMSSAEQKTQLQFVKYFNTAVTCHTAEDDICNCVCVCYIHVLVFIVFGLILYNILVILT